MSRKRSIAINKRDEETKSLPKSKIAELQFNHYLLANGVCFASNAYGKKKYTFQIFLIHNVLANVIWYWSRPVLLLDWLTGCSIWNQNGFSDRENTLDDLQSLCSFTSTIKLYSTNEQQVHWTLKNRQFFLLCFFSFCSLVFHLWVFFSIHYFLLKTKMSNDCLIYLQQ